uniref:ADP,ATP carrier protein n=1 Tax=Pyramimonas obovata TaxID=1411642 RepID=A0A7S0WXN8_9CHLO|mmetsp:Transcript_7779/g.15905  ORF Transcript_7779/g.15905 Transcript_7779/m.15905 type:complete len:327 (+) Transcript_7779:361-1341(+)|eukprot:CAMPEP_0118923476 /NCGR_PEP_ID=MMETSP1169-20130426/1984_1 /TAXON_ID=36882 /ORGANISM="Pyramimonas obovata, Strain CCMP722" /LENGTH=326 /DNA_ID=CAMNT_0006864461 /DNA_START=302 /DNA_END=1282 /DNA_ORIENTATION=-
MSPEPNTTLVVKELMQRPVSFVALVPEPAALFIAGAFAGTMAKTVACPLDRTKLLLQVKGGSTEGLIAQAAKSGNVLQTFMAIGRQEGLRGYFKGNVPQIIRAIPYDAVRLSAYEAFKTQLTDEHGHLPVVGRLTAGACAAMTSTLATYPLDTIRFRMAVDPTVTSMSQVVRTMVQQEGMVSLYKGVRPSMIAIAPYIALNYTAFDIFKSLLPPDTQNTTQGAMLAALAATGCATSLLYPMDTLRRQMQLKSGNFTSVFHAARHLLAEGGACALYRGFLPSCLKTLPTNSVRLTSFDFAKSVIADGKEAYHELVAEHSHVQPGEHS